MPQKYDKHFRPLSGFSADPDAVKRVKQQLEEAREKLETKRRARQFMAEPEELAILDAIEKMPAAEGMAAAEGALIARRYRRGRIR